MYARIYQHRLPTHEISVRTIKIKVNTKHKGYNRETLKPCNC